MKSLLTVAALLAALSAPALAEEAVTAPPPQSQAVLAPSQDGAEPAVLPPQAAEVVPMSAPLDSNGPPPARSGCHHQQQTTEVLTN